MSSHVLVLIEVRSVRKTVQCWAKLLVLLSGLREGKYKIISDVVL